VFQARLAIQSGMAAAATGLAQLPTPTRPGWADWSAQCQADYLANLQPSAIAELAADTRQGVVSMPRIIATLQQHLPADAVLTNGAGNFASWLHRFYRYHGLAKGCKTQLAPTNGAMGYGVPAGIAAAITSQRTVFTLSGDGDFLMNGQELATAVQYGAKTIILLLNNGMYGTIRMHQEREYPQRVSGSALRNPDFCALARAYGYAGARVSRTGQFEPELLAALARPEGTLIELMQEPQAITTRGSLNDITQAALTRQRVLRELI
jgi:acetolactate synthase-1/2/3 large subunit